MFEEVKFTKSQRQALKQIIEDANKSFDESMIEKPYLYHEYDRSLFVHYFISCGINSIIEKGYFFLVK